MGARAIDTLKKRTKGLASDMESYFDRLWPICRSLAGPGYRQSLGILEEIMPMEKHRFATGTQVFDWTVPREWVARDAYFLDPQGLPHAPFERNNLHLLGYSIPYRGKMPLKDLLPHLHSLPENPKAVPYRTSYYQERWGFCLSHEELLSLPEGDYEVFIDTEHKEGDLIVGEAVLPGATEQEVLFSTYLCHPSLANNELSGPLVTAFLYDYLKGMPNRRFTYRFVVVPETIGALCYLKLRGEHLKKRLSAGYVVTCVGDPGKFTYKKSRQGNAVGDRAALLVLEEKGEHRVLPFRPDGSDERQYCSPGFDLPVGSLMRTPWRHYPEYHTSLDNKEFIRFESLLESLETYIAVVEALESNIRWKGTVLYGEPQLGKRGLYPTLGSQKDTAEKVAAMMWLLNLADGTNGLFDIAERSGQPISVLAALAQELSAKGLLVPAPDA